MNWKVSLAKSRIRSDWISSVDWARLTLQKHHWSRFVKMGLINATPIELVLMVFLNRVNQILLIIFRKNFLNRMKKGMFKNSCKDHSFVIFSVMFSLPFSREYFPFTLYACDIKATHITDARVALAVSANFRTINPLTLIVKCRCIRLSTRVRKKGPKYPKKNFSIK